MTENSVKCPVCGAGSNYFSPRRTRNGLKMGVCLNCTLGYANPLVEGAENDVGDSNSSITSPDYYSQIVRNYDIQSSLAKKKAPQMIDYWASVIGRKPISILEIGCGTGQYCEAWKQIGVNWTGVEINREMLAFCRSKEMPVVEFNECFKSNKKYDVVFLSQVLEHVLEPHDFLDRINKLLTTDGILHIDVPNHNSLTSLFRIINIFHSDYGFIQPMHHLIAYTKQSLSLLLERNKFKLIHVHAYTNDHSIFGQLLIDKSIWNRFLFYISRLLNRGSLLVCIAKKRIG